MNWTPSEKREVTCTQAGLTLAVDLWEWAWRGRNKCTSKWCLISFWNGCNWEMFQIQETVLLYQEKSCLVLSDLTKVKLPVLVSFRESWTQRAEWRAVKMTGCFLYPIFSIVIPRAVGLEIIFPFFLQTPFNYAIVTAEHFRALLCHSGPCIQETDLSAQVKCCLYLL